MRYGSAPNFCPPVREGMTVCFEDENGDCVELEFLGLILHEACRYGFFYPYESAEEVGCGAGELIVLEVTSLDDEGQPESFELLDDSALAAALFEEFKCATKDLYDFC